MQKQKTFLIPFMLLLFSAITAFSQTYYLNEPLTTQASFNKFTAVNVIGEQAWYFSAQYGACMNGYNNSTQQSYENEDWFITPAINLQNVVNPRVTFQHTRGPAGAIHYGVAEGWYKVFATAHYTGNVATTQWIEITGVNHATTAWQYVSSGELAIPEAAKSANTQIAFRYYCSDCCSATWEIKNVVVFNTPPQEETVDFKITTWNVDWLSCTNPEISQKDRELQIKNVVSVIKTMNSDLVALQEVGTSSSYATINILLQQLGSEWAGNIAPWSNDNCSQNQGIVYKKSKIQSVNSSLITNGGSSYNWSNGRFPALYNVNLTVGNAKIPVSFINIHAKAFSDETSYARRKDAATGLKTLLDGNTYNTKRLVVIGDFNDYLMGTTCTTCGGISPYKNFMDDALNYKGLTTTLTTIDNIIISNELFSNYLENSLLYELSATQTIPNYYYTTSNHYPVSVTFRITEQLNIADERQIPSVWVYPNPTTGELTITNYELGITSVEVFDIYGRNLLSNHLITSSSHHHINISHFSTGMYFIKISTEAGEVVRKVVKE
jgi:endonuclease/exonuclease/phosphatase family metal-dependent hydrolase